MTFEALSVSVTYARNGRIALAVVDNPPVNALSHHVRSGLMAAISRFTADPEVAALVLVCRGRTFMAGADIREFGKPIADPQLGAVVSAFERSSKPVIAAIHGTALGGGLEIALACHYRVALRNARLGFPEVKLGILPGAGGTLRLPRLAGMELALRMISEGTPISADDALAAGILDEITDGDLEAAAVLLAERIVDDGQPFRRTSDLVVAPFDPGLFETARVSLARKFRGREAPQAIVDLMRATWEKSFREAERLEHDACARLLASSQSKALRHNFAAERRAAKVDDLPATARSRAIRNVAIVGPGVMGRGIAVCFLNAGFSVQLLGLSQSSLDSAISAIGKIYDASRKRGLVSDSEVAERLSRLSPVLRYDDLAEVDIVIEAVTEDLATKIEVFRRLDAVVGPDCILATNTSFLDVDAIADAVSHPENVCGMHFFNPAHIMKLLENVRVDRTADDVVATLMQLGKTLGKTPVLVGRSEGFVANRMLSRRSREALFLLEEGATPWQVDRALTDFGFPMGPFALADLSGLDVVAATRASRAARMTLRERDCDIVETLVAAGRLGQKADRGYYAYDESRKASPDPDTEALIAAHSARRGISRRKIPDAEIVERCLFAMINEGALILEEGAAQRASDIDVVWTSGFGFPAYKGGPMFHADEMGLPKLHDALAGYAESVGATYFTPAPLIAQLAARSESFASWHSTAAVSRGHDDRK